MVNDMLPVFEKDPVKSRIVFEPTARAASRDGTDGLKQRCHGVYGRPLNSKNAGSIYTEIFVVREDMSISPLAKPKAKIKVADVLP